MGKKVRTDKTNVGTALDMIETALRAPGPLTVSAFAAVLEAAERIIVVPRRGPGHEEDHKR